MSRQGRERASQQESQQEEWNLYTAENHLVSMIYRFAGNQSEWFQLLLGLTHCLAEAGPGPSNQSAIAQRLLPHFKEAIAICAGMAREKGLNQMALAGLDRLAFPAGLIDSEGRILCHNRPYTVWLERQNPGEWCEEAGRLRYREAQAWQDVFAASAVTKGKATQSFGAVQLVCSQADDPEVPRFFALLSDTTQQLDVSLLQQLGLTDAETKVAVASLQEVSAEEIAHRLGIRPYTVRDHLSSIYAKLGITRKPELIQFLLACQLFQIDQTLPAASLSNLPEPHFLVLRDGRRLCYFEHGSPAGMPVLLFHNVMGSGHELPPNVYELACRLNLRIVVPERPGYGESDPLPRRGHADNALDMEELLAALGIDEVVLMGHSIGCMHAYATASHLGPRVRRVIMVSPMPRYRDLMDAPQHINLTLKATMACVKYAPFLLKPIFQLMIRNDVDSFLDRSIEMMRPAPEEGHSLRHRLNLLKEKPYISDNLRRSMKQGMQVWVEELELNLKPWTVNQSPYAQYEIWHGDLDPQVPIALVEHMAKQLKAARFEVLKGEGHGFLMGYAEAILESVAKPPQPLSPQALHANVCT